MALRRFLDSCPGAVSWSCVKELSRSLSSLKTWFTDATRRDATRRDRRVTEVSTTSRAARSARRRGRPARAAGARKLASSPARPALAPRAAMPHAEQPLSDRIHPASPLTPAARSCGGGGRSSTTALGSRDFGARPPWSRQVRPGRRARPPRQYLICPASAFRRSNLGRLPAAIENGDAAAPTPPRGRTTADAASSGRRGPLRRP